MLETWYAALSCNLLLNLFKSRSQGQNGPAPGVPALETWTYIEKYFKIFFQISWLRCLKFGKSHGLLVLYNVVSNEGLRFQMVSPYRVLGLNHRNT